MGVLFLYSFSQGDIEFVKQERLNQFSHLIHHGNYFVTV